MPRITVTSPQPICDTLETARALLRELIDNYQNQQPAALAPTGLLRILVHVVNIQKMVEQASDDPANAVRRLVDFSNTIERIQLPTAQAAEMEPLQLRLVATLRLAAEELKSMPLVATRSAQEESTVSAH